MPVQDTTLSTSSLFHYTYDYNNLLSILKEGFQPKYSLEKLSILKTNDLLTALAKEIGVHNEPEEITDELAIAMACFCDIPLNLIGGHVHIYGKYTIGLTKEWGIKNAISPVFYIADSETRFFFDVLIRITHRISPSIHEKVSDSTTKDLPLFIEVTNLIRATQNLIMFVKPYQGNYERPRIGFSQKDYRFYDEREWRYRPPDFLTSRTYLTKDEFNDPKIRNEYESRLFKITFSKSDITHILLPNDEIDKLKGDISSIKNLEGLDLNIIRSIDDFI
jgi:hypothetical protein